MTRLDLINEKISQLRGDLSVAQEAYDNLRNQEKADYDSILKKYFGGYENENIIMDNEYQGVGFRYVDDRYTFLSVLIKDSYRRTDGIEYVGISLSHSSNRSEISPVWVEQLEAMAYFAKVANDYKDDILAELNGSYEKFRTKTSEAFSAKHKLEMQINELESNAMEVQVEELLEKVKSSTGLSFEANRTLPDMQVKFDHYINNITNIKLIKESTSGASVDLEYTTYTEWSNRYYTDVVTRVKKDRLIYFLQRQVRN